MQVALPVATVERRLAETMQRSRPVDTPAAWHRQACPGHGGPLAGGGLCAITKEQQPLDAGGRFRCMCLHAILLPAGATVRAYYFYYYY